MSIKNDNLLSPITNTSHIALIDEIEHEYIINKFLDSYKVDVSEYFTNLDNRPVQKYKCLDSHYEFYFPFELAGKPSLYESMSSTGSYYRKSDWEIRIVESFINEKSRILEIGCGEGYILNSIKDKCLESVGLEFSLNLGEFARSKNLDVRHDSIGEHSKFRSEYYDIVMCFQVLEHVANVKEFLDDCLSALKKGGILILGVPNNDSFIKYSIPTWNLPPHHMGLWGERSLRSLPKFFPMSFVDIFVEPISLSKYFYLQSMEDIYLPKNLFSKIIYFKLGVRTVLLKFLEECQDTIKGSNIVAAFSQL